MRRVLLVTILLLLPAISAEETDNWIVEVEDPFGNPIENCDIILREPWSGSVIQQPVGAMYHPSASCEGYVVMWHPPVASTQTTVVLEAHPIIDDLFSVIGADSIQVIGSDWEQSVTDGPVNAPSGVPILVIGEGGTKTRFSESTITIPNSTTTYDLAGNYSANVSVTGFQIDSGKSVEWDNQTLTVGEFGGGWYARVLFDGIPVGESTWPPTESWILNQSQAERFKGESSLDFYTNLFPNTDISANWSAHHKFNLGLGLPFIPGVDAGIISQVNRFLSNDVSQLDDLLESIIYQNGREALCCIIDNNPVMFESLSITSEVNFSSGYWGWQEFGEVKAQRSQIDLVRVEVPFQNDLRQTTPLTIKTNGDWQYRSSPLNEWIEGIPSEFTLKRDSTSVSGFYTISLGENYPPSVELTEDYALPWENSSYNFEAVISDAPLSIHSCQWDINGLETNSSVNLSAFEPDSVVSIEVTCTDEGGLNDTFNTSLVLDDEYPVIDNYEDTMIINPGLFQWDLNVSDDHDNNLRVYWTSNKSGDWWYTGSNLQTSFYGSPNLNSVNDNISERHKQRNPTSYWLAAEVSDDVGHVTHGNWTIQLSDNSGPVILASIEKMDNNGVWKESASISRPGDKLRLNLTASFDDHDSIDKINFSINLFEQKYSGLSWDEAQYWELPDFGTGYYEINIQGRDQAGNNAGNTFGIAIAPPIERDLEIIEIKSAKANIEPGENQFWITVQNNGASTTEFILCSKEICESSIVGPSTYSTTSTTIVSMKVDMDWFETFAVDLSYQDDSNKTVVKYSTSDYNSGTGIGALELFGIVIFGGLAIIWLRSRNEPKF